MRSELEVYQLTSVGDRQVNQDCMAYKLCSEYGLFIVADGLGGHYAGEKASQFFCQSMFRQVRKFQPLLKNVEQNKTQLLADWVAAAIDDMAILFGTDKKAVDAHTTAVVLYLDDKVCITAHCGDSRIYRLNAQQLVWRTKDHSLIQEQLEDGSISEQEMGLHPEQNQLTRTINIQQRHQVEVKAYPPIEKGETFVLCTDGFWEFVKEKDLLQLADKQSGKRELKKITKMMHLRARGKGDNLTVQWIRCH